MITTTSTAVVYSVAERLERLPLTNYHKTIFFIIATAWFFDCLDVGMMTFVLPPIKSDFNLNSVQTGLLGSMSFVGMFFGAAVSGLLADRFGRCLVLQWSMVVWGIGSILCASAGNLETLMLYRIFLGIGMGMELPAGQSLLCEMIPAKARGRYVAYLEGFWPVGFIAAGLLSCLVLPIGGWRLAFIVEAIPAVFAFIIRRYLPESPRWLTAVGKKKEAELVLNMLESKARKAKVSVTLPEPQVLSHQSQELKKPPFSFRELWATGYVKRTIMLWLLWFFALLGYWGLTTWLGTLLQAAGYTMTKSTHYTVLISLSGIPGFLIMAWLLEVWGRKPTMILTLLGSALMAYFYGTAHNFTQVIVFGLAMQFFMFGMWSVLYAYTPELYPSQARATGAGCASAIGRLGALIGPYSIGIILPIFGQTGVFSLGAVSFVAAASAVLLLGEETKSKILEEISR